MVIQTWIKFTSLLAGARGRSLPPLFAVCWLDFTLDVHTLIKRPLLCGLASSLALHSARVVRGLLYIHKQRQVL